MKYTILVRYITGDSYGEEETSESVGLFNSLEEAQAACEDILDHYKYAKERNYTDEYRKKVEKKSWYHNPTNWSSGWVFTMETQGQVIGVSWTGCFERLLSLHIQVEGMSDYYA